MEKKETIKNYNIRKILLEEKKINKDFCNKLHRITIEDIVALKLELAATSVKGKLYGFPIKSFITNIINEALIKYSFSVTKSYREAGLLLGLTKSELYRYGKRYKIWRDDVKKT